VAHLGLGEVLCRVGRWEEAADELARAAKLAPTDHLYWMFSAIAQLRAGRIDVHRQQCREMLRRFGDEAIFANESRFSVAERVAKVCLLRPAGPDVVARAGQLAERGLRAGPASPYYLYAAGLADYRSGRYESALDRLRRARGAGGYVLNDDFWGRPLRAWIHLVEAMAQARLGRASEAGLALEQAERLVAGKFPAAGSGGLYPSPWQEWAHCEILRQEAWAIVGDRIIPADPFAR
jgi:tetratricopeptide (TPR) repeat protein